MFSVCYGHMYTVWGCVAVIYVGKAEKSIARQEA